MKFISEEGKIFIVDTTLRDGEQTAGVVFANSEKTRIASMLDEIGVNQLEVGIPAMGGDENDTIAKIAKLGLKASIMAWNRAVINDVKESLECGVDSVAISISTSEIHIQHKLKTSKQWVLDHMTDTVRFAKKEGVYVSVNAEDASRTKMDFLIEFAKCAKEAGADRLRFCDTVGILDPFKTYDMIKKIKEMVNIDIEMHTHNDFGMATANALAGLKAGANFVGVTVNGLGERAGNAALEEIVMALKHIYKHDIGIDTTKFRELSEYVSAASGRQLPSWKAIVGTNIFAHESGIHVDGTLKDPHTYEIFDPDEVGLERQIVIGKHSGTAALVNKFKEYGRVLPENEAKKLLPYVRSLSIQLKRPLFDKELIYLYEEHISNKKQYKKTRGMTIEFNTKNTEQTSC